MTSFCAPQAYLGRTGSYLGSGGPKECLPSAHVLAARGRTGLRPDGARLATICRQSVTHFTGRFVIQIYYGNVELCDAGSISFIMLVHGAGVC